MQRIITFPRIGKYTDIFKSMLTEMGINVQLPPPITENTIKHGCKHSADMMCFPYKVSLGNLIEILDIHKKLRKQKKLDKITTILMFDTKGTCRFRHYWILQKQFFKKKKYEFEMYPFSTKNMVSVFKKLGNASYYKIIKTIIKYYRKMKVIDKQEFKEGINIGIIGEVFTCLEPAINLDLVNRLKKLGVNVYETVTMHEFLKSYWEYRWNLILTKRKYKREASKFLNGKIGGHGYENIYNTLWLIDQKINGIIHLLPLSCMPDVTVEPIINDICRKNNVPLLRIPVDETNSEVNINTRVEAFVELIKRKK